MEALRRIGDDVGSGLAHRASVVLLFRQGLHWVAPVPSWHFLEAALNRSMVNLVRRRIQELLGRRRHSLLIRRRRPGVTSRFEARAEPAFRRWNRSKSHE